MIPFVLPNVLMIAEQSSQEDYMKLIFPELKKIFHVVKPVEVSHITINGAILFRVWNLVKLKLQLLLWTMEIFLKHILRIDDFCNSSTCYKDILFGKYVLVFPAIPAKLLSKSVWVFSYSTGASDRSFYPIFNKRCDHLEALLTIHWPKKVLSAGSLCGLLVPSPQYKCPKRTFMLPQKYHASVSNMLS